MPVEVPVQKVFEKYKNENAQLTERAIVAESAQEVLEEQLIQTQLQLATAIQQLQESNPPAQSGVEPQVDEIVPDEGEQGSTDEKWPPATNA